MATDVRRRQAQQGLNLGAIVYLAACGTNRAIVMVHPARIVAAVDTLSGTCHCEISRFVSTVAQPVE